MVSGKQTVRSLVETWRAASHRPQGLAHGTNTDSIQGLTGRRGTPRLYCPQEGHTDDDNTPQPYGQLPYLRGAAERSVEGIMLFP
ncbi:hypothetical protein [uncultured Bacteroides sp.]|uniref:hypothetical protein n=1 Tax=uncultured Bacteroides sp. TaxID=162156 RepID=UPI002613D8B0|nr:hypothetical protein [uncultured Bacteroides sp.]